LPETSRETAMLSFGHDDDHDHDDHDDDNDNNNNNNNFLNSNTT
jgi:hypothetical protein